MVQWNNRTRLLHGQKDIFIGDQTAQAISGNRVGGAKRGAKWPESKPILYDSKVRICSDRLSELTQNHLPEVVDLWGKAKGDFQKIKVTAAALRGPLF